MISPYGVSMALAMCYFGSCGQSAQELKKLLGLESLSDEQIIAMDSSYSSFLMSGLGHNTSLKLVNKLYLNSKLKINPDFQVSLLNKLVKLKKKTKKSILNLHSRVFKIKIFT